MRGPDPTPAYQRREPAVELHHADVLQFLASLPDQSVDLIVTDPAYSGMNQHLRLGRGRIVGAYKQKGGNGKWFKEFHDTQENYRAFLEACFRVLKPDRHIYIMFDSYSLLTLGPLVRSIFDLKNLIVWDKVNIGMGHYFRRRHELILFASKGKRALNTRAIPDIWRIKRVVRGRYPTQKPVELFEAMLAGSSEPGFVVCDPFVGGGSSAIAAIRHNCRFIGCDISARAIEVASQRIDTYCRTGQDPARKPSRTSLAADQLK